MAASAGRTLGTTAILVAARLFGAALAFGTQVLVSRLLGPEALGTYLLLLAAIGIAAVVLPLGFQALAPFFVAEYDTVAHRPLQRGFLFTAYATVLAASLVLAAGGMLAALVGLDAPPLAWMWLVIPAAPAAALLALGTGVALGLKRPFLAMLPDLIAKPVGLLAAALGLAAAGLLSPWTLVAAFAALLWIAASGQAAGLARVFREQGLFRQPRMAEHRRWWSFAPAWLVIVLIAEFTIDLDLLLLGAMLPASDIGIIGAAMRVFVLESFALTAVYAVTLPGVFAVGRGDDDRDALSDQIGRANLSATLVAAGCLLATIVFGPLLLAIFGPDFAVAQPALLLLVASLVVKAVFGPGSVVLSIFDRPYASVAALIAGLVLLLALNAVWVPAFGITGAAAALSTVMLFWSLCQWLVTWRLTGRNIALRPGDLRLAAGLLTGRA